MFYSEDTDDKTLVAAVQSGDEDAFAVLVRRYEKTVYRTAYLVTGNAEDAADLSQEILFRMWAGMRNFRGEAKFFTWLVTVAKNTSADWVRKKKRTPKTVSMTAEDDDADSVLTEPADTDPMRDPVRAAERNERGAQVRAAIASLDTEHKIILTMRDMDGLSYEEIAKRLDLRVGTVKSRISRARTQVKKLLENGNFFEHDRV